MFHILFQKFNYFYENCFEKWGRFLAKYHVYVIVIVLIMNVFLGLFLFRMEMITDSDALFMPTDSEARIDERHIKTIFNSSYYLPKNFYMHQLLDLGTFGEIIFQTCGSDLDSNVQNNILQEKYINEILKVNTYVIKNTYVTADNLTYGYNDVCARRNGKCLIDGEDLLSKDFYKDWVYDSMLKKTRMISEQQDIKSMNTEIDESESRSFQNEFNMYIKLGGGLTELTYNLGNLMARKIYFFPTYFPSYTLIFNFVQFLNNEDRFLISSD